jgi:hypothetical protein
MIIIQKGYTGDWYAFDLKARLRWRVFPEDWSAATAMEITRLLERQRRRTELGWRKPFNREEFLGCKPPVHTAEDYARIYSKRSPQKDG